MVSQNMHAKLVVITATLENFIAFGARKYKKKPMVHKIPTKLHKLGKKTLLISFY